MFESAFERQFGRRDSRRGVEMVNLRVIGRIPMEAPAWTAPGGGTGRPAGARLLLGFDAPCDVWARADILPDTRIAGPAVIEEMSATTWLPPGWTLSLGTIGQMELIRTGDSVVQRSGYGCIDPTPAWSQATRT